MKSFFDSITQYDFRDKAKCNIEYIKQFLRRTNQMFDYTGLPETIPKEFLELYLQCNGYAGITKHNGELYAFFGGLGGEPDAYYQPTKFVIANPALNLNKTCTINEDCVIIRNDVYFQGLLPILKRYATALVENDISMEMVSKNMRQVVFITAPTDNLQKAAQQVMEDIDAGVRSVSGDSQFLEGIKVFPMQTTHGSSITELIEYHQYLRGGLYNEIGLNANYNMKREKLNDGETALNQDSLLPLIDEMLAERMSGVERVNAMFGTNITVSLSETWQRVRDVTEDDTDEQEESDDSERSESEETDNATES